MSIDCCRSKVVTRPLAVLVGVASLLGLSACGAAKPVRPLDSFSASGGRGSLIGVIRDVREDPIPGARVLVLDEGGEVLFQATSSISTDGPLDLGAFKVEGIPPGRYQVVAVVDSSHSRSRALSFPITAWLDTRVRLHVDTGT